jgi:hypothetical protein
MNITKNKTESFMAAYPEAKPKNDDANSNKDKINKNKNIFLKILENLKKGNLSLFTAVNIAVSFKLKFIAC